MTDFNIAPPPPNWGPPTPAHKPKPYRAWRWTMYFVIMMVAFTTSHPSYYYILLGLAVGVFEALVIRWWEAR